MQKNSCAVKILKYFESVTVQPNSSKNDFTMLFHGESNMPVQIRITVMNGKLVGLLKGNAAHNFTFGSEWAPGIYLVEAVKVTKYEP